MMIRVMYYDRKYDMVNVSALDKLITSGRILKFYRTERWITIGKDPIRGLGGTYNGHERRGQVKSGVG
ncbi:MAG TPA: hypothetical protein VEE82_01060 [Thermodesulfovibrionales bacterium]|nr:hypothetical protein [Thermodesulfovibrionales bacterium]